MPDARDREPDGKFAQTPLSGVRCGAVLESSRLFVIQCKQLSHRGRELLGLLGAMCGILSPLWSTCGGQPVIEAGGIGQERFAQVSA